MADKDPNDVRILLADDDHAIRQLVTTIMRRERLTIDAAVDGIDAIELLKCHEYAVILLDLMMPRVDGLGVLRFLEENRPELSPAVIVMSANVPSAMDVAREGRVSRVLSKPFDLNELLGYLRAPATV